MQVMQNYRNWLIAVNKTGDTVTVQAYSKTIPVKQFTADSVDKVKTLIDKAS